jgi:hypothetical protein
MWQVLLDGLSVLGEKWIVILTTVGVTCLGCGVSFFLAKKTLEEKTESRRTALLPGIFLTVSLILRLAFLREVFVPPYFDSVEHYRITKQILTALETSNFLGSLPALTSSYYHLGFHFLVSFLAFILRADPIDVILVLGQVILAAIPIPIFFLIRHETQSEPAAFFGMLLAGFGWYMPGFAVNWGKYPALAGLLCLEIVLSGAYFVARKKTGKNQFVSVGWLILGTLLSTLFHTRTLVIILISIASWLVTGRIPALQKAFQYLIPGILLAGILVFGKIIQGEPLLDLVLDPYLSDGIWVTLIVLALSPFVLVKFPQGFYFTLLFILCVLSALFIPVGFPIPGLENQTILDRPFVEMLLYLPLSILAGLGLAGLLQALSAARGLSERIRSYARILAVVLMLGFTGMLSVADYDFYPSDCCNFVGHDDTVAFDWLDKHLPPEARTLVAGTQLNVLPAGPSKNLAGSDAGIWIRAMSGRHTSLAPFDTDFRSASTLKRLCQRRIQYIYIGGTKQIFNTAQFHEKAEWYDRIFFLPDAQLYRLTGCSK